MKKVHVILGSTRKGRAGEAVTKWATEYLKANSKLEIELVDLLDYPLPALDSEVSPLPGATSVELVAKWAEKISQADGYIFVSPEYNHGYAGELKNAIDSLKAEWAGKPAGIIGYGGIAAGARAMEQLRLVLLELKVRPTHSAVHMPMIWEAMDESGQPKHDGAEKQLEMLKEELESALQ